MKGGISSIPAKARIAYQKLGKKRVVGISIIALAAVFAPLAIIIGIGGGSSMIKESATGNNFGFEYNGGHIIYHKVYVPVGGLIGRCNFECTNSIITPQIKFELVDSANFNKLVAGNSYSSLYTRNTDSFHNVYWSYKVTSPGYYYELFHYSFSESYSVRGTGSDEIDTTPPDISHNLTQGQSIPDGCTIQISATDSQVHTEQLMIFVNGANRLQTTSSYLNFTCLKAYLKDGVNKIEIVADDHFANRRTITVYVKGPNYTPPQVEWGSIPAVVHGICSVPVILNRTVDIKRVELYANGTRVMSIQGYLMSPTTFQWNSREAGNGMFELMVVAVDLVDNSTAITRNVISDNDYVNPQISFNVRPETITGACVISANVHDNLELTSVDLYINGTLYFEKDLTGQDAVINITYNPGDIVNAVLVFELVVYDAQGNIDVQTWQVRVDKTAEVFWNNFAIVAIVVGIAVFGIVAGARVVKKYKATHPPQPATQAPAAASSFQPAAQVTPTPVITPDVPPWITPDAVPATSLPPSSFHDIVGDISIPDPTTTNSRARRPAATRPRAASQTAPPDPAAPPAKPLAADPTPTQAPDDIDESDYAIIKVNGALKVPRVYIDTASINAQAKPVSDGEYTRIGNSGKIEVDLFCKQCHQHVPVQEFDPAREYPCPTCHTRLSELRAPVALPQRDLVKLDPVRLDCLEIMVCLFKEGYFTRSGRLRKKTIQKLNDDGKISVLNVPKLIDLLLSVRVLQGITNEMIYIDPEIMKVPTEAELSKKVLEYFDAYDEKIESFRF